MTPLDPFEIPLAGTHLIEANAGTGKTHTIVTLCLRLLLERQLDITRILIVTYTNAATAELRRTVRDRITRALAALRQGGAGGDDVLAELVARRRAVGAVAADCRRLEAALAGFDEAPISTIHGFCQRVLDEHAFESGSAFDTELIGDERLLIDEVVRDFWTRELFAAPPELVQALSDAKRSPTTLAQLARIAALHPGLSIVPEHPSIDLAAGGAVADTAPARVRQFEIDAVAYAGAELRRRKQERNRQSFNDLLQRLDAALQGGAGAALAAEIRTRMPVALIDEFQDTDPIQYRIFDTIFAHRGGALFLIGDPKQAIYGFRGADVFAYLRAKRAGLTDAHTLVVNWRSTAALVRAVNTLFVGVRAPFVVDGIPFNPSDPAPGTAAAVTDRAPLRFLFVRRAAHGLDQRKVINKGSGKLGWLHDAVAGEIVRLLADDHGAQRVVPGDIAVICRTNAQTLAMQEALRAAAVPSVVQSDTSVFDTAEAHAVERVLRALADPKDDAALSAALVTSILGLSGDELFRARGDEAEWGSWVERCWGWSETWKTRGFTTAFRRVLDDTQAEARVLAQPGGERCLTNVFHLGELLQAEALTARCGPLALVEWLARMRGDPRARGDDAAESAQIRLESDTYALKLTTIHKSKGLQYPLVVCPFLWDGTLLHEIDKRYVRFHDPDAEDRLTLDIGSLHQEDHKRLAEREALAENLRLLYVALTRARRTCLVVWGKFNSCETSALGYLLGQAATAPDAGLADAVRDRIKGLSDSALRGDLERIAAASEGSIEVVDLTPGPPPRFALPIDDRRPLVLRDMSRAVSQRWRMASFSALAAADRALPEPVEEGIDRDETADPAPGASDPVAEQPVRGFPRGRRLGNLVHKLFETIDFADRNPLALRARTAGLLPAYGLDVEWAEPVAAAVTDVLDTPLDAGPPPMTLRQIPAQRRISELEFVFPAALSGDERPAGAVTADRLAEVFAAQGPAWLADEYAARLRRLPFSALAGYIKGYIDLVFEHGGRWFLVDYKTNDLGRRAADYRPARLLAEMMRHHYVLQYHLYAVALHRYLQQRVAAYAYEDHFGGVLYLFVRGMAPAHEAGCGVFAERPSRVLIEALSAALARPDGGREPLA